MYFPHNNIESIQLNIENLMESKNKIKKLIKNHFKFREAINFVRVSANSVKKFKNHFLKSPL